MRNSEWPREYLELKHVEIRNNTVYVRNNGLNKLNGQWREAIWTARLVCKATYEASDFISSHQTR